MGQRLGVYCVLACLALATAGSPAAAQSASPPAAPPPAAQPAPNAPVPPSAVTPNAAAAAPESPAAATEPGALDKFDLVEGLKGNTPLSSKEAAERAVKTAPSVAKAEATAQRAAFAAEQANIAVYPRLELEARASYLSHVGAPAAFSGLSTIGSVLADQELRLTTLEMGRPATQAERDAVAAEAAKNSSPLRFQDYAVMFQARMSWPVSAIFLTVIPRHEALVKAAEAQQIQVLINQQGVRLQAREAYYNYARTRAALMVAKAALAQTEAHRKDSDALVSAGSIARVELMRADAQVAAAKVSRTRAEFQVGIARSSLFTLIHMDGNNDVTIAEDLEVDLPPETQDERAVLKIAVERRSELRALRVLEAGQERSIAAQRGQAWPVVAVGGTADWANPNQRYFGTYQQWRGGWALFASLVWSPNDTFAAGKGVDVAKSELLQTKADYASMLDALRIEVSQAYNAYSAARVALDAARTGIQAAEESYRVRREQFRAGAAIAVDVIDAENQLRQNRLDLVNTFIDLRIAKARLDRAVEAD
jgi:hypothetical protein